ncbi:MAG: ABC transporter permease [Rhizobiaceae bacterium MnEN-MB40S]|nr:MAG: ABC transporter permease [Rhizobiaceae bacterium MnEN-MB40S]
MLNGSIRFNLLLALPALILTILLVVFTASLSSSFLSSANLANLTNRVLPLGMVALGEAIVLMAGRIDLSVGTIMSLATAIMALTVSSIGWLAIPLAMLAGVGAGLFTAAGVILLRINPLVMSLATAAIVKGVTLLLLPKPGGQVSYDFYALLFEGESPLGVPLLIVILVYGAFILLAGWTRFGRSIYAAGSDPRAAFAHGVSSARVDLQVYALSGALAALAGVFLSIRILSGDPLIGDAYTLDAVSAAILGGIALKGGRGNLIGVLLAVISLVLINNTFNLLQLDTNLQAIAKGLIFVAALVFFMRGKAGDAD